MSDEGEKSHEPTQKKLDDARKQGDFPRSNDLTTAAVYGGFVAGLLLLGGKAALDAGTLFAGLLGRAATLSNDAFNGGGGAFAGHMIVETLRIFAPMLLIPTVFALLAIGGQRGFAMTPSKIAPKGSRLNPLQNFGQKFGRTGLVEFLKSFAKLGIYATVLGIFLSGRIDELIGAMTSTPGNIAAYLGDLTLELLKIVCVIALVIGLGDLFWQRTEFRRKHMMTRQELIDEMKQSEGDPALKQQRRQKGISIAMNKMLKDVETADVIIVNPTHYAVALKWDKASRRAPVCVAKGVDEVAAKIREVAQGNAVPIHSDPPTARALHATIDIGQEIRPDHYKAVAAAIRFAEAMRKKAKTSWKT